MNVSEPDEPNTNPLVALLSDAQRELLFANGRATLRHGWFGEPQVDRMPVAMLRCSCGAVYLLSELDPTEPAIMYGLYEDSEGTPTLDTVDLEALSDSMDDSDHRFENVLNFVATDCIRSYWRKAVQLGSVSALFDQVT
jgi:hypothetical protein